MIYAVENETREIYECQAMGDFIMIRPAEIGLENHLQRVDFIQFSRMFDASLAQFLIPDLLDGDDYAEGTY